MMNNTNSENLINKVNRQSTGLKVVGFVAFAILVCLNIVALVLVNSSIQNGKQSRDRQLHALQKNQDQILCITRGFVDPTNYVASNGKTTVKPFIDKCIVDNQ